MTLSSTGPFGPNLIINHDAFVPFVIYAHPILQAGFGKRWEQIYEIEKLCNLLEMALVEYEADGATTSAGDNYHFEFSKPVKYRKGFGDRKPVITVNGNYKQVKEVVNKHPIDETLVIEANEYKTGYEAANNGTRVPSVYLDTLALTIFNEFSNLASIANLWVIDAIEVAGVRYGMKGRTIA